MNLKLIGKLPDGSETNIYEYTETKENKIQITKPMLEARKISLENELIKVDALLTDISAL
jgi:hypothetical protein